MKMENTPKQCIDTYCKKFCVSHGGLWDVLESRDVCSTVVRVSAFRSRNILPGSKCTPVSCVDLVCPSSVQDRMRNDSVLCQNFKMALSEVSIYKSSCRGIQAADNRIKLASEEGIKSVGKSISQK